MPTPGPFTTNNLSPIRQTNNVHLMYYVQVAVNHWNSPDIVRWSHDNSRKKTINDIRFDHYLATSRTMVGFPFLITIFGLARVWQPPTI